MTINLANVRAAFLAIQEYLDGACEHRHHDEPDCYICEAWQSATKALAALPTTDED